MTKQKISYLKLYLRKCLAKEAPAVSDPFQDIERRPYPLSILTHLCCFCGVFVAIVAVYFIELYIPNQNGTLTSSFLGSFGASVATLFCTPNSPTAQPKSAILGQLLGAFVGISMRNLLYIDGYKWLCASLSVAITLTLEMSLNIIHPPSASTAFSASIMTEVPLGQGYLFLVLPVLAGEITVISLAIVITNANPNAHYPDWYY